MNVVSIASQTIKILVGPRAARRSLFASKDSRDSTSVLYLRVEAKPIKWLRRIRSIDSFCWQSSSLDSKTRTAICDVEGFEVESALSA